MDALECVGIDLNAEFMGDGRKMQDGVCRAGNCRVHDNGVFKALPRHDIAGRQAALCQLHSLCARFSGHFHKIRAGGRQKRAAGSVRPSASHITCIVPAVPIKLHAPQEGQAWCL